MLPLVILFAVVLTLTSLSVYAEDMTFATLPEPGTVLLMGLGLAAIGLFNKRGRRMTAAMQRWLRAKFSRR